MNTAELMGVTGEDEPALRSLHHWLQYQSLTFLGGAAAFFVPYRLVAGGLALLALVFTPYMIWQLAVAKRYKTIATFSAVVLVPIVAGVLFTSESSLLRYLLTYGALVPFYIFTWVLKGQLDSELQERRMVRVFEHERRRDTGEIG